PAGQYAEEHRAHQRGRHGDRGRRGPERRALVLRPPEVHGGHDAEVVDESHDAGKYADDGQPYEATRDRGLEHHDLAREASERRDATEAEEEDREGGRQAGP